MSNSHDLIQFLTFPRTGSSHTYYSYAYYQFRFRPEVQYVGEFFNINFVLTENWYKVNKNFEWKKVTKEQQELNYSSKLKFLEEKRKQGIHFNVKAMGYVPLNSSIRDALIDYLSNYKICTIRRDPFDCFLAWSYMNKTRDTRKNTTAHYTTISHGFKKPLIETMNISHKDVEDFNAMYNRYKLLINDCNIYHTFNFENLQEELDEFFPSFPPLKKNQIDYKSLVSDLEEAKWLFDSIVK